MVVDQDGSTAPGDQKEIIEVIEDGSDETMKTTLLSEDKPKEGSPKTLSHAERI